MAVFADLNVPYLNNDSQSDDRIRRVIKYGYGAVAINNFVQELSTKTGKKETKKNVEIVQPYKLKETVTAESSGQEVAVYTRFSVVLSDSAQVIRLQKDPVIQSYDLLAVQPTTEKLFLSACKDLEIDIISLDFTSWLPFQLKHTAVGCALKRGVHFEILYSPLIRDSKSIKSIIYNCKQLFDSCHGKSIIISSGCEKSGELRAPYSVMSLACIFGLTKDLAKAAISSNCRSTLLHAAARKSAKGVLSIMRASNLGSGEQWKIPQDPTVEVEEEEDEEVVDIVKTVPGELSLSKDEVVQEEKNIPDEQPSKKMKLDIDVRDNS